MFMALERDLRFDTKNIAVRDQGIDTLWDGRVRNLVYNTSTMEWEAQTPSSGGGGGGSLSASSSSIETRSMPMSTLIDETSNIVTYIGEAAVGSSQSSASWRIKRISQSGAVLVIEWADGNGSFNKIWDNRASLTYS